MTLEEAIQDLATWAYRFGMTNGSGSEYFVDGKTYTLTDCIEKYRAAALKVNELLPEEVEDEEDSTVA